MNILCLDQFGELGGAQRCLLDEIPAMIARGPVHVAVPGGGSLAEQAVALGATASSIRCGPYSSGKKTLPDMARFAFDVPRVALEIRSLVRGHSVDLMYVNGPRLLPAVALSLASASGKGPGVLFHSHSLLDGHALRLAGRSLATARAAVVASCNFVAAPLLGYCGERGVRVVYNGVRRIALPCRRVNGAEFRIGLIGRISPEKGQADFLRAARIVYDAAPGCRFIICGAPLFSNPEAMRYSKQLEALAADLPVEFAGWTENVESVFATLDLLVVPSTGVDATPRVILESFAAGVPVLAFASGGIPEIVEHGVTGFLVEERSPEALASAIRDLLREPDRMRCAAARAREKVCEEFSLEGYREKMMDAIDAALG